MHQVLRDLGFMAGDLLHLVLPWMELKRVGRARGVPPSHMIKDKDAACAAAAVAALWIINALM